MDCKEIKDKLDLYIDDEILLDEEKKLIEEHLKECKSCNQEYEEMIKIKKELEKLKDIDLPKDFHKKLMKNIRNDENKKTSFFSRHYKAVTAVAAVSLVGIVATSAMLILPNLNMMKSDEVMYGIAGKSMDYSPEYAMVQDNVLANVATLFDESDGFSDKEESVTNSDERKVIKNIYIAIDTENIENAFNEISFNTEALGGYVEYSSIGNKTYGYYEKTNSNEEMRYASINIRIPSDELNNMILYVESFGDVTNKSTNTVDQTDYYYDIDNQIKNLEAREDRLRDLMNEAKDISDIIEVERELTRVRNEIDALTRNLAYIDKSVDYSFLNVQLREIIDIESKINPVERNVFDEAKKGIIKNINRLINFIQSAFIFIISYLPMIVVIGVVVVIMAKFYKKMKPIRFRKKQ